MKKEITVLENYLLILSDEETQIKVGEYFLLGGKFINKWNGESTRTTTGKAKKITWHKPLNGAKPLDGVMLLPELEDDLKSAILEFEDNQYKDGDISWERHRVGFKAGYSKNREKYRFTEEDMKKAFDLGFEVGNDDATYRLGNGKNEFNGDEFYKFIESLQQLRHPSHFEFEAEVNLDGKNALDRARMIEKTIITSLGHKMAVGKYLFD